jgi:hypothetical protein
MRHTLIGRVLGGLAILGVLAAIPAGVVAQGKERRETVAEKQLPKPVSDAFHSHRRAIFVSAVRVTRGASVEYHLTLKGSRKTAMVVKPDGTVVSFK